MLRKQINLLMIAKLSSKPPISNDNNKTNESTNDSNNSHKK